MTNVMDLEGISVSILKPKVLSLLRQVQDGDEKHYPGMVNVALLTNASDTHTHRNYTNMLITNLNQ